MNLPHCLCGCCTKQPQRPPSAALIIGQKTLRWSARNVHHYNVQGKIVHYTPESESFIVGIYHLCIMPHTTSSEAGQLQKESICSQIIKQKQSNCSDHLSLLVNSLHISLYSLHNHSGEIMHECRQINNIPARVHASVTPLKQTDS